MTIAYERNVSHYGFVTIKIAQDIAQLGEKTIYCTFLSAMHIEMHMDTVQCPMLICDIIDPNIAVTALLLQMYLSLISESSLNRVSDFNF